MSSLSSPAPSPSPPLLLSPFSISTSLPLSPLPLSERWQGYRTGDRCSKRMAIAFGRGPVWPNGWKCIRLQSIWCTCHLSNAFAILFPVMLIGKCTRWMASAPGGWKVHPIDGKCAQMDGNYNMWALSGTISTFVYLTTTTEFIRCTIPVEPNTKYSEWKNFFMMLIGWRRWRRYVYVTVSVATGSRCCGLWCKDSSGRPSVLWLLFLLQNSQISSESYGKWH